MKTAIHPATALTTVTCGNCGATFTTRSARAVTGVEVCSACHPAYTGVERTVARGGRIDRFERRRAASRS